MTLADRVIRVPSAARAALACALVLATACEPEGALPPKTPQPSYAPGAYGGYGSPFQPAWQTPPAPPVAPTPAWAPPPRAELPPLEGETPEARKIEGTLDEPAPGRRSLLPPDVRDPWARDARPVEAPPPASAPSLPQTHLVAIVTVEAKGKHLPRLAAAKRAIASKGGVRRGEGVWEIPTDAPDRAPAAVRAELEKVLCVDDRLTLFYVSAGALVKLEVAGAADCDAPAR